MALEAPPPRPEAASPKPEAGHRGPLSPLAAGEAPAPRLGSCHRQARSPEGSPQLTARGEASPQLTARGDTVRVRVVARVRPLLPMEMVGPRKGTNCVEVASPSVAIGKSCFTFDHVFSPEASQEEVYEECVAPLVEATLEGVNGTLLAYGQTGSGKTYTMGSSGLPGVPEGAIQRAVQAIFARAQARNQMDGSTSFRVSFAEIFTDSSRSKNTEEIRDLLSPGNANAFAVIKVDLDGQIRLDGVLDYEVWTEQEALSLLALGSASRATGATRMNDSSSRSHAIFALEVVQRRLVGGVPSTFTAKFQFVDLAGSEKVKLSGAEGEQLSQAININHGLFVLGKAITALTEGQTHVPFRESKLTRLLQNSLGGNSRTCMLACVSPSDANLAETVSTLTYAAKAKEIKNKPVVNRGMSCANCAILQAKVEELEQGGKRERAEDPTPVQARSRCPPGRQERFHTYVVELEKENVNLKQENLQLQRQLEKFTNSDSAHAAPDRAAGVPLPVFASATGCRPQIDHTTLADAKALEDAKSRSSRAETLYKRCSERLAALQQAVQAAELAVDETLLCPEDASTTASDFGIGILEEASEDTALEASEELDDADADFVWLEQETRRKQSLLLQVEENHQAMAVLEAQSHDRIKHYEAALDIAERELSRLQAELSAANNRAEKLKGVQESYDQKLAAVRARRADLEKENRENRRLRSIQQQQETRLRVLQASIRQVKDERDALKGQLRGEVKRRKEQEAQGRKAQKVDSAKIQKLTARIADLERSLPARHSVSTARLRRSPSAPRVGQRRLGPLLRSASCEAHVAQGGPWRKLLVSAAELSQRERQLWHAKAQLEDTESQVLEARARCERLSLEAEVDGGPGPEELAAAEQELAAVGAALEYRREQVWLLTRERDACRPQGGSLAEAAARCAEGMRPEELTAGLTWLCVEANAQRSAMAEAIEARDAKDAEILSYREALEDSHHRAMELEQAFDFTRGDYESRIAYLISRLNASAQLGAEELQEALGEDAPALLTRRIGELEAQLTHERRESKDKAQRRLEQDMELITNYREQESDNKMLRSQLVEAKAAVERAVARGARKEAQLQQQVSQLEADLAMRRSAAADLEGPRTAEVSWGLKYLEDFWRTTGLDTHREELLVSLQSDVESLCQQRLSDHLEWKRALEAKIDRLQLELSDLGSFLGQALEAPPADASLLRKAQDLEASIGALSDLKEARARELAELTARLEAAHGRLHDGPLERRPPAPEERGALHEPALARLRERLASLEAEERDRLKSVAERFEQMQQLWAAVGLEVPDDLEPIEVALVQGPLPVSDSCITYLDSRLSKLANWRDNLEPEESALLGRFADISRHLTPIGVTLPEVPQGLPLLPCIKALRTLVATAECTATEVIQEQKLHLQAFGDAAQLPSVFEVCSKLEAASGLNQELAVLGAHWPRLAAQRAEHQRVSELIASREALEAEMRKFDAEASNPERFRKRGYSGVQENKIRADYQRRLRMLDASLEESTGEWAQREGVAFCAHGGEYRGAQMLPSEHTHMYAWTGKQVAQKHAVGQHLPRSGVAAPDSQRSPRSGSAQRPSGRAAQVGPAGAASPRAATRAGRGSSQGPSPLSPSSPKPTAMGNAPTRVSTGGVRSPAAAKLQTAPPSARRRSN